ncbi:zf-HC2 domain-containing protein [Streptomyces lydicus]|nr:zf-HC2 domain-containing protein [Streptomyces lydicus]
MLCSRIRTALSARLDGEELPPGLTPAGSTTTWPAAGTADGGTHRYGP